MRAAWSLTKRSVNRFVSHGLLLPAPFTNESWMDTRIERDRLEFFVNLGPDALTFQVPYLSVVFDLQHRYQPFMPELCHAGYWERWEEKYRRVLGRATYVVTGTRAGRDEITQYYAVPEDRILILPHPTPRFALAAASEQGTDAAPSGPVPYVFYPAQFWPHKNHVTLLEALAILRRDHQCELNAVLVGADDGNLAFVKRRAAELGVETQVAFPGVVSRAELLRWYRGALALAYVSTCGPENLPPLEAFALGVPVVAGRVPGAEEQLGEAALLVEPTDARALADALLRVARDASLRCELIRRGRDRAGRYTNREFARGIFAAIDAFEPRRKCWSAGERYKRRHVWTRALGG
jgi:glycosyltransferase involved in cell wall biosynthesis